MRRVQDGVEVVPRQVRAALMQAGVIRVRVKEQVGEPSQGRVGGQHFGGMVEKVVRSEHAQVRQGQA